MENYVDTDIESLIRLQKKLEIFSEQTETMKLFMNAELDEFEEKVKRRYMEQKNDENSDDFNILWNRYLNCRDNFQSDVDRLLKSEIVNSEGRRNLCTLISVLEEYLNMM